MIVQPLTFYLAHVVVRANQVPIVDSDRQLDGLLRTFTLTLTYSLCATNPPVVIFALTLLLTLTLTNVIACRRWFALFTFGPFLGLRAVQCDTILYGTECELVWLGREEEELIELEEVR